MSGTLACSTATVLSFLEVDLDQVFASRLVAHVADSPPNPVNCSPIASRWQLSTSSETAVRFGPGKAKAQVFAHLLVAGTDFTTSITSTVSLRRG
jgi:hypothetical protein